MWRQMNFGLNFDSNISIRSSDIGKNRKLFTRDMSSQTLIYTMYRQCPTPLSCFPDLVSWLRVLRRGNPNINMHTHTYWCINTGTRVGTIRPKIRLYQVKFTRVTNTLATTSSIKYLKNRRNALFTVNIDEIFHGNVNYT